MTSAEFEALPCAVAEWIERLYVAADGGLLRTHSLDAIITEGAVDDVLKRYKSEMQIDIFYGGKL